MKELKSVSANIEQEKLDTIDSIKRKLFSLYRQSKINNDSNILNEIKSLENELKKEREFYR